ncbi:MAG: hypothetical protein QOC66_3302 [Pseudonocardiales bacterium]|jgi:hypothetical protein|nr:hypothetical protein [Pseudonocardiales bacterium]
MIRARHALAASIAATALLASAACTGGGDKPKKTSEAPSTTASSSTAAKPPPPPPKNPYTGVGGVPKTPTISVKIDDTAPGRPQRGINAADIVYIEAVEGGLTRLAAIFGTNKPKVGYIRSTRPSDPDLLLQFGKITAAYSGGAHDALPLMRKSGLKSWSNDAGAAYYSRVNNPSSSYINLVLDLSKVAKKTKTAKPKSIGWQFNPSLTGLPVGKGTDVRTAVTGSYSNGTPVEFRYSASLKKYVRYIGGVRQVASDGKPVTATNVIVQSCRVVSHSQDTDVNGNPSQFTYTVGRGKVSVFRQGKRIDGTWTRPKVTSGTTLRTTAGKPLPLAPGNTWVVLIRTGIPVAG